MPLAVLMQQTSDPNETLGDASDHLAMVSALRGCVQAWIDPTTLRTVSLHEPNSPVEVLDILSDRPPPLYRGQAWVIVKE